MTEKTKKTEDLNRYHIIMRIDSDWRHFTSRNPKDVLKLLAETKPTEGYLVFEGVQLRSILDAYPSMKLANEDLPILADVVTWEKECSTDGPFAEALRERYAGPIVSSIEEWEDEEE